MASARIASDGSVRPMLAAAMAMAAACGERATITPIGTAMAMASASADAESATCVPSAVKKRSGCARMNCQASTNDHQRARRRTIRSSAARLASAAMASAHAVSAPAQIFGA